MTERCIQAGNIFSNIPEVLPQEDFSSIVASKDLRLDRIVSRGHSTPEDQWYDQEQDEWVIVLKGKAVIRFECPAITMTMGPGDYVFIPAHKRHRVEWTSEEEDTVWLALHFSKGDY